MEPDKGDKTITVTRDDVREALTAIGVARADTAIFHSSLSSMGTVVGGAHTVIDGFLDTVGPRGTVAAPTLWWYDADPPLRREDWNIEPSPSYVGAISETLRLREGSIRSDHPTHSVSGLGFRAADLTRGHGAHGPRPCPWGWDAFAAASPWQRLYDWNAAICFIGVDLRVGTMRHFAEAVFSQTRLDDAPAPRRAELASRLVDWGRPGVWTWLDGLKVDQRLTEAGLVKFGRLGSATLRMIRTRTMVDALLQWMVDDPPGTWFRPDFTDWLREAAG